ncbi:MAG: hypothetical protein ABJA81_07070 [Nocardioidaceae bacterium]
MLTATIGAEGLSRQLDVVPGGLPIGVNFLVPFIDLAAWRTPQPAADWSSSSEAGPTLTSSRSLTPAALWLGGRSAPLMKQEQRGTLAAI